MTFDLDLGLEHTLDLGLPANRPVQVWSQTRNRAICLREKANLGRGQKCPYHVTFDFDLDLEHTLDAGLPVAHRVKFGSCPAISLGEEAIFVPAQKCPYHVTFDFDLDIEHILDAR